MAAWLEIIKQRKYFYCGYTFNNLFCLDGATYFEKLQMHVALPSVLLTAIVVGIVATILVKKKEKQRGTFNSDPMLCCNRISGRVQLKKGKKRGLKMVAP